MDWRRVFRSAVLVLALFSALPAYAAGLCAVVKIQIQQELTMERQGFDAHMSISNGLDTVSLQNVGITVEFSDDKGNPVVATSDPNNTTASFFIRQDTTTGIDAIDGTGTVQPATTADIHWLIIPAAGAAGNSPTPKLYFVGATLTYSVGGVAKTLKVDPDTIYVEPMPKLTLDYFLPNDVYADDPFTPQVEPSVPFTLGVRVSNSGFGKATNLKIDSAQPEIVENKQGLLINFALIGSSVNDAPVSPTLLLDFGNLDPGTATVGRWDMTTTLSGKFTAFTSTFTHADSLGGALTSLIDAVNTHFLIHDVLVDLPGRDNVRDFLALDANMALFTGTGTVNLYESEGGMTAVTDRTTSATLTSAGVSGPDYLYDLVFPNTPGFSYVKLTDPLNGSRTIKSVTRSDGKSIPLDNAWLSQEKDVVTNTWKKYISLFDANSTGTYRIVFGPQAQQAVPPAFQQGIQDYRIQEGKPLSFTVAATTSNGSVATFSSNLLPVGATLVDQGNGTATFSWTPKLGQAGSYPITIMASDGQLSTAGSLTITVALPNTAPVAGNDTYVTNEDVQLAGTTVLANDTDADGNALTAVLITAPTNGQLTLNADGTFTYLPNANWNGSDSFTYVANDGLLNSNVATVTITVNPVNDAPTASAAAITTAEDTAGSTQVAVVDPDIGDTHTFAVTTAATNGVATVDAAGAVIYTPNLNYFGADTFTITVTDAAGATGTAAINVTVTPVNDAPTSTTATITTNEDTTSIGVTPTVVDVDDTQHTFAIVTQPVHGTASVVNNQLVYMPSLNFNGADSFSYSATDSGGLSVTGTANVTVNAVNDAPVAANDTYVTDEDVQLTGTTLLANDTDVDSPVLTAVLVAAPANGQLTLNSNGTFTYLPNANWNGTDSFTYVANDGLLNSNVATVAITVNPVNDAPTASATAITTAEDTAGSTQVVVVDPDIGDTHTFAVTTAATNGVATVDATGAVTYTPNLNYFGADTFTITVTDAAGATGTAAVNVTVTPVNDAPTSTMAAITTNEDTQSVGVTPAVVDVDDTQHTFAIVTQPAHGQASVVNNQLVYMPGLNFNGADSFTYSATDSGGLSVTGRASVTVIPVNDAPVATNDAYVTDEDVQLTGTTVLANDTDVDSPVLTAVLVTAPAHGKLTLNSNGTFTYLSDLNWNGTDSFTYKANDGQLDSNIATVTITVNPVNDAPTSTTAAITTNEDTQSVGVTPAVVDVDDTLHTFAIVTQPAHGQVSVVNNQLVYMPSLNFNGADSFTYSATDSGGLSVTGTASVTVIPVNDAPVATNDAYVTDEDVQLTGTAVLANDTDVDSPVLTAVLVTAPAHGKLTLNADGTFTYLSDLNWNGTDSFTYKANDGQLDSNIATVTITVNPVNDAPVATNDTYVTDEDVQLTGTTVLANDSDVDSPVLTAALVTAPAHGKLTLNSNGIFTYLSDLNWNGTDSFTYKANDGQLDSNVATVTITVNPVNDAPTSTTAAITTDEDTQSVGVTPAVVDVDDTQHTFAIVTQPAHGQASVVNNQLVYMPSLNFNGADSFTYSATDSGGLSVTGTASVTVIPVNDAPVATNDAYVTDEDVQLTGTAVLANDTDVDSPVLTAVLVTAPAHGKLVLNADGTFTYLSDLNWNGTDSFTYKANDGQLDSNIATVTITVNPVNDPPVATAAAIVTDEDTAGATQVMVVDPDIGDTHTFAATTPAAHGTVVVDAAGMVSYMPNLNYFGSDAFAITVTDAAGATGVAQVAVTVNPVNDPPVAAADTYVTDEDVQLVGTTVLANDTDVDSPVLTAVLVTAPAHGKLVLNADGTFTYLSDLNWNGTDSFSYKANDGQLDSNIATVTITVNPVNDAPVATNDAYVTDEDVQLTGTTVLANDTDVDSPVLTAVLVTAPAHGKLTLNANGTFTYLSDLNWNGTDSFTYKANDGQLDSNVATVTITVNPVNDAPVATNDAYVTDEDVQLTGTTVLANDTDVDSPVLTAVLVAGPAHGKLTLNSNGTFTYLSDLNWNGTDSFTYKANDGQLDSNVATVTITVNPVNDPPVAVAGVNQFAYVGETVTLDGSGSYDIDSPVLTYRWTLLSKPSGSQASLPDGRITSFVPDVQGSYTAQLIVNDGQLDSQPSTVAITVAPALKGTLEAGKHGRLLALVYNGDSHEKDGHCSAISWLSLRAHFAGTVSASATALLEAYDGYGHLQDSREVHLGELPASDAGDSHFTVDGFTGDSLSFRFASHDREHGLEGIYSFAITIWNDGQVTRLQSDAIRADCNTLRPGGAQGDIALIDIGYADGTLASQQTTDSKQQFLQQQLAAAGWSANVVADMASFVRELHTGAYNTYAVLTDHWQLDEKVRQELREAVYRGEGLIVGGKDIGELETALGVGGLRRGHAWGVNLTPTVQLALPSDASVSAVAPDTAEVLADYTGMTPVAEGDDHGHEHEHGRLAATAAATLNSYGSGKAVYVGFDLLGEAMNQPAAASFLTDLLDRVQPDVASYATAVYPLHLTVENRASVATSGRAVLPLPAGVELLDKGQASVAADGSLVWSYSLAANDSQGFDAWVRLPAVAGQSEFVATIERATATGFRTSGTAKLAVDVTDVPDFAAVAAEIAALNDRELQEAFGKAQSQWNRGYYRDALERLLELAGNLEEHDVWTSQQLRRDVSLLIRSIAMLLPFEPSHHESEGEH